VDLNELIYIHSSLYNIYSFFDIIPDSQRWTKYMNKNLTILIIDDIQENIDILEHQLTTEKFNVLTANEGPKGLHILKKDHIEHCFNP